MKNLDNAIYHVISHIQTRFATLACNSLVFLSAKNISNCLKHICLQLIMSKCLISRKSIDYNLHHFVFNTSGTFFKDLCCQGSLREDTVFSVLC